MTDRTERVVVSAIALSLPLAGAVTALVTNRRVFEYSLTKIAEAAAFEIIVLLIGWRILRARGWTFQPFRLHFDWTSLVAGFLCAPGYLLLTYVVYSIGRSLLHLPAILVRHTTPPLMTISFFVLNSYFEESFASAYLIESFERTGTGHPLTWAAAIRASYHLYQGPLGAICIFFLGLAFGAIYKRTRYITLPFIAHTAINTTILALSG